MPSQDFASAADYAAEARDYASQLATDCDRLIETLLSPDPDQHRITAILNDAERRLASMRVALNAVMKEVSDGEAP